MPAFPCLPDGNRLLNKLPNSSFPRWDFYFSVILSHLFLCGRMMCGSTSPRASSRGKGPSCSSQAVPDLPTGDLPPCSEDCRCPGGPVTAPAAKQRQGALCWALQAACFLVLIHFTELTLSSLELFYTASRGVQVPLQGCLTWLGKEESGWRAGQGTAGYDIRLHMFSVTFSTKLHLIAFSTSKWGWQWFCRRRDIAGLNPLCFTPLSVKWCEMLIHLSLYLTTNALETRWHSFLLCPAQLLLIATDNFMKWIEETPE